MTRTVTLPTVNYSSTTDTNEFPPVAKSTNTQINFTTTNLAQALQFNTGPGVGINMFDMYDAYKVGNAVVTWRHSPGPGQNTASPVTPYTGSYYMQRGVAALAQDGTQTTPGLASITSLPWGKKHGGWRGSRKFFPTAMETTSIYQNAFTSGATPLPQYIRMNHWFMTRNVLNNSLGSPINFIGPNLLLPGMEYVGNYLQSSGITNHFIGGQWEVSITVQVHFKGPRFGWQSNPVDLKMSKLHQHTGTKVESTTDAWNDMTEFGLGDTFKATAAAAAVEFGTAAAAAAINKFAKKSEL